MERETLRLAMEAVSARKAIDPVVLDISRLTALIDFFLICSAQTSVQIRAIADHLQEEMDRMGVTILRKEGGREARWLLLDYGWFAAHIMLEQEREFYQLERLWHDAARVEFTGGQTGE